MITQDFYYVDKTGMIKELLDNWGKVNLFTRPRRFGKSLNMSMLRRFFEIGADRSLFEGLAISEETELCEKYMGRFPVISISLKTVEGKDFSTARANLCTVIGNEAMKFHFLLDEGTLTETERKKYGQLINAGAAGEDLFVMSDSTIQGSLKTLSDLLYGYYGEKVILLIDEYDVPLQKASAGHYYDQMVSIIRGMFNPALKSNDSLYFAVMTGCLRVAKESIFTGLNNLKMYTMLDARCDERFGFADEEVVQMLGYYGLSDYYGLTKEWYDGYRIGGASVYNPWDVINWCDQLRTNPNKTPKSYWANSSSNEEVRKFIQKVDNGVTKAEIERLISGETVQKKIEEQLTYNTMYDSIDNMWSLLYATGYLTQSETPMGNLVRLTIPNTEVRNIFSDSILGLFKERISQDGKAVDGFCEALKDGNVEEVEKRFTEFLKKTISIRDTA
ncbi:MAG: AAA family ATPase, partial [Lachnospiraceae bacterium]|nr:AAA family ATPase [Lachnospiraceae bacterium]